MSVFHSLACSDHMYIEILDKQTKPELHNTEGGKIPPKLSPIVDDPCQGKHVKSTATRDGKKCILGAPKLFINVG